MQSGPAPRPLPGFRLAGISRTRTGSAGWRSGRGHAVRSKASGGEERRGHAHGQLLVNQIPDAPVYSARRKASGWFNINGIQDPHQCGPLEAQRMKQRAPRLREGSLYCTHASSSLLEWLLRRINFTVAPHQLKSLFFSEYIHPHRNASCYFLHGK